MITSSRSDQTTMETVGTHYLEVDSGPAVSVVHTPLGCYYSYQTNSSGRHTGFNDMSSGDYTSPGPRHTIYGPGEDFDFYRPAQGGEQQQQQQKKQQSNADGYTIFDAVFPQYYWCLPVTSSSSLEQHLQPAWTPGELTPLDEDDTMDPYYQFHVPKYDYGQQQHLFHQQAYGRYTGNVQDHPFAIQDTSGTHINPAQSAFDASIYHQPTPQASSPPASAESCCTDILGREPAGEPFPAEQGKPAKGRCGTPAAAKATKTGGAKKKPARRGAARAPRPRGSTSESAKRCRERAKRREENLEETEAIVTAQNLRLREELHDVTREVDEWRTKLFGHLECHASTASDDWTASFICEDTFSPTLTM